MLLKDCPMLPRNEKQAKPKNFSSLSWVDKSGYSSNDHALVQQRSETARHSGPDCPSVRCDAHKRLKTIPNKKGSCKDTWKGRPYCHAPTPTKHGKANASHHKYDPKHPVPHMECVLKFLLSHLPLV